MKSDKIEPTQTKIGPIQTKLDPLRQNWTNLDKLGQTQTKLDQYIQTWTNSDKIGPVQTNFYPLSNTQIYLHLFTLTQNSFSTQSKKILDFDHLMLLQLSIVLQLFSILFTKTFAKHCMFTKVHSKKGPKRVDCILQFKALVTLENRLNSRHSQVQRQASFNGLNRPSNLSMQLQGI